MTTKFHSITLSAAVFSLIALSPLASARPASKVTVAQEARETLKEMKGLATAAFGQAEQLKKLSNDSEIDAEAHREALQELKLDINDMGREIANLDARRGSLEPWEQQAVDRILPLLREAAANAQSATQYFNKDNHHLWTSEYRAFAKKISSDSDQIARTLKNYLKFEKVREEEQQLQSTIESGSN